MLSSGLGGVEAVGEWRENPVLFVRDYLGVRPWRKQEEILNAIAEHNYVAVRSCNGSGKTFTAALATIWWLASHEEAIVVTTAPSERQVKNLLWREIRDLHTRNGEFIGGQISSSKLELSPKRYAFGFSTNTGDRFQGFHSHNLLIIVDEAAGVPEFAYDAISGCMTTENVKLLLIGNPTTLAGTFYNAFHKNRHLYETIRISAFDTPAFTGEIPPDRADAAGRIDQRVGRKNRSGTRRRFCRILFSSSRGIPSRSSRHVDFAQKHRRSGQSHYRR